MCTSGGRSLPVLLLAAVATLLASASTPAQEKETGARPFPGENVFLGKGENDELIVEAHYRSQAFDGNKSILTLMFLPTEHFEFEEEYRGFARITFYKLKKNSKLAVKAGDEMLEYKLRKSYTTRSIEAFDMEFERKKALSFIPDVIDSMAFPFKGVVRWEKVSKEDAGKWSKSKEALKQEAEKRREARRKQKEIEKGSAAGSEFSTEGGLWVSVNSTYVFEKKDPDSRVLAKLPLGTFLEKVKKEGTDWFQVIYGDPPITGFVPSLMLASSLEEAVKWEEELGIIPVDTPLLSDSLTLHPQARETPPPAAPPDTLPPSPPDTSTTGQ